MAQKRTNEMFKILAQKYDLPIHVIEEVYQSEFKKLKEEINSFNFKTVKLPSFGKYGASKTKILKGDYETRKQERLNKENNGDTGSKT